MIVYESEFTRITYEEENLLLFQLWKTSFSMTDDLYKREVSACANSTLQNKANCLLSNIINIDFIVTPELQEWNKLNFFQILEDAGIERYGIILNTDLFSKLSVNQSIEEAANFKLKINFFSNVEVALNWLNT